MFDAVILVLLVYIALAGTSCSNHLKRIADKVDPPEQKYVEDTERKVWM